MDIIAVDPGDTESGWVIVDTQARRLLAFGKATNADLHARLQQTPKPAHMAIEMIASYGMPVGATVFDTCVWIGRFIDAFTKLQTTRNDLYTRLTRAEVKMALCKRTQGVNDSVIRQRLLDLWGPLGTKKNPGPTYGMKGDAWAALGVATTWMLQHKTPGTETWRI